tara:strand:+ start:384 stop:824 length:441 start_codon:yes stop_codon:yes gene_type:complete
MNNLYDTYTIIKNFADDHHMINEFVYVKSETELDHLEFNYRTLVLIPLEANISRRLNSPVYTLDFGLIVLDKVIQEDDYSSVMSTEENIFVIGQLQDYLMQLDMDTDFDDIDFYTSTGDDYNISSASASFSVTIARSIYTKTIDKD